VSRPWIFLFFLCLIIIPIRRLFYSVGSSHSQIGRLKCFTVLLRLHAVVLKRPFYLVRFVFAISDHVMFTWEFCFCFLLLSVRVHVHKTIPRVASRGVKWKRRAYMLKKVYSSLWFLPLYRLVREINFWPRHNWKIFHFLFENDSKTNKMQITDFF